MLYLAPQLIMLVAQKICLEQRVVYEALQYDIHEASIAHVAQPTDALARSDHRVIDDCSYFLA